MIAGKYRSLNAHRFRFFNSGSYRGFTLIEILVVIFIIILLFSLGYTNFREYSRRQFLNSSVRSIESDLRLAQQMAYSGEKTGVGCTTLLGYRFDYSVSWYALSAVCLNLTGDEISNPVENKNPVVLSGVSFTGSGSILFKVLGAGTNLTETSTISIATTSGLTAEIQVGITGQISVAYR